MEQNLMAPLWLKYPSIPEGSIGWRMGYGESYAEQFYQWFYKLTPEEQNDYKYKFPEPVCWSLSEHNIKRRGDFWLYNWEAAKSNMESVESLKKDQRIGIKRKAVFFWGHHPQKDGYVGKECFSQWYRADFYVGHLKYCCMEQYMMSKKALLFGDIETNEAIMNATSQGKIKSLGRSVKNFNEGVWKEWKQLIVLTGNYYKFSQLKDARRVLLETGDAILAEASPNDTIWGIGMAAKEAQHSAPAQWRGSNLLGFALMTVRAEIARLRKYENEIQNL